MPAPPKHRPIRREFLEKVARPVLARALAPSAELLLARGVDVPRLGASPATDRRDVERLVEVLSLRDEALDGLHALLLAVDDAASTSTQEALFAADTEKRLDPELGVETLVAVAALDHPELFARVRPHVTSTAPKAQAHFAPKSARPLPHDAALDDKFERRMKEELAERARSDYFRKYWTRHGEERHLEIVFGRLSATRDVIGKTDDGRSHDLKAQVTDRSPERAFAIVHEDTGILTVSGAEWAKELVRRVLGEVYFGSADHYRGDETLTLAPMLEDLDAVLSATGVPDLVRVELLMVELDMGGWWDAFGARGDLRKRMPPEAIAQRLGEAQRVDEAHFALFTAMSTKPVTLKVKTPKRLTFPRTDARVVRVVRDWMVARGIMRLPAAVPQAETGTGSGTGKPAGE